MRPIIPMCLLAMVLSHGAVAQTARKDSGNNAQLLQQMQQLAAERTQLSAENARLKRELDELRKERDSLKGERETTDQRARNSAAAAARVAGERERTEQELNQLKDRANALVEKFRETVASLREVETDRAGVKQQLTTRDTELKSCINSNVALYDLNGEILTRMENQGFWSGVARAEPFTKLKRVELENLADEYKGRAEDAKVPAPVSQVSEATAPPG